MPKPFAGGPGVSAAGVVRPMGRILLLAALALTAPDPASAQAQSLRLSQDTTLRADVGVFTGGFLYYFGTRTYPHLSLRLRQGLGAVAALEVGLTAVAAGMGTVCPADPSVDCDGGDVPTSLFYPSVGGQLRLPGWRVEPFMSASVGAVLQRVEGSRREYAMSTSLALGAQTPVSPRLMLAAEARMRGDDIFRIITTTAYEASVGLYWALTQ